MSHMKQPCKHCPYRYDVKPFLRAERGAELAHHASNPYNSFSCHKTTEEDEDSEDGEMMVTENSLECAGFMSMQHNITGCSLPEGFEPSELAYSDTWEMIDAYEEQEENERT